jgi:hypothetical protein
MGIFFVKIYFFSINNNQPLAINDQYYKTYTVYLVH